MIRRANEQPIFGWGGWGRNEAYFDDEHTKKASLDGFWVITLGQKGRLGLSMFFASLLLPAILFIRRFPARMWGDPQVAAGALAAVLLAINTVNLLLNGFVNIIYLVLAGGLASLDPRQLRALAAPGAAAVAARARHSRRSPSRPPAGSPWRNGAAAWGGASSRRGGSTRPTPPGGAPSSCSPS